MTIAHLGKSINKDDGVLVLVEIRDLWEDAHMRYLINILNVFCRRD